MGERQAYEFLGTHDVRRESGTRLRPPRVEGEAQIPDGLLVNPKDAASPGRARQRTLVLAGTLQHQAEANHSGTARSLVDTDPTPSG
jgi:hypothetical protein